MRKITGSIASIAIVMAIFAPSAANARGGAALVEVPGGEAPIASARWVDDAGYVRLPIEELRQLSRSQGSDDIETILASGRPVNALVDSRTGSYLAAAYAERATAATPMAITPGGCGYSTSAKLERYVGGLAHAYCFQGTGTYTATYADVMYIAAGAYTTRFYYTTTGSYLEPLAYSSISINAPYMTVYKVSR